MPRQFVILDRDGTIIKEKHYLSDPAQVELIPGTAEGLQQLNKAGLGLIVVTNQSGIGRGLFDSTQLELVHAQMCELLKAEGVVLDGIYFCPHTPEDRCTCRKPAPALVEQAAQDLGFDPQEGFVIGDSVCDIELGQRLGATTFLVRTGYGAQIACENATNPDYIVDNVSNAAPLIERLVMGRV